MPKPGDDVNVWSGLWEDPGTNLHFDRVVSVDQPPVSRLEARLSGGSPSSPAPKEGPKPKRGLGGTVVKKLTPEEMLAQAAQLNSKIYNQALDSTGRPSYVEQLQGQRDLTFQNEDRIPQWLHDYMAAMQ